MDYIGIGSFIVCFTASLAMMSKHREVDLIIVIATLLRFAMVAFYSYSGDSDPDGYGIRALYFSEMSIPEAFANFPTGAYFYSWLISFLYRVFGESALMVRSVNGLMSVASIVMAYELICELYGKGAARKALMFLAVFPALLRFSAPFASRETLYVFLEMISLKNLFSYYKGEGVQFLFLGVLTTALACIVHTASFMFFVLMLLIVMNNSAGDRGMQIIIGIIGAAFVGIGIWFMTSRGIGTEKLYLNSGGLNLDKLNWISESSAEGRAAYLQGFTFTNPVLTALFLPVRAAFFLYAPFIWMIRAVADVFGFIDAALYLLLTYYAIKNVQLIPKKTDRSREELFVVFIGVMLLCMLAMFAIGTSNYGTALRHRAKLVIFFVILCGPLLDWPMHISKKTVRR